MVDLTATGDEPRRADYAAPVDVAADDLLQALDPVRREPCSHRSPALGRSVLFARACSLIAVSSLPTTGDVHRGPDSSAPARLPVVATSAHTVAGLVDVADFVRFVAPG